MGKKHKNCRMLVFDRRKRLSYSVWSTQRPSQQISPDQQCRLRYDKIDYWERTRKRTNLMTGGKVSLLP